MCRHIFQTFTYLNRFKKKGYKNVIYFYGEVDIKNFFFLKWARLTGYKIVIDVVEDLEAFTSFKSFKNKLKYKSGVFFRKRLSGYADGFTVVSSYLEKKLRLAYPGIPLFFLPVTINKYLLTDCLSAEGGKIFTVFYSGSFNEKDGLPYLLSALSRLAVGDRMFKLVLSGKGTAGEMNRFWADVNEAGLADYTDYRGFLTRRDYTRVLWHEADVLCMTRTNSAYANAGFPFKLGEFLATGKPVIASVVSDIEKYLSANDAYLVPPEDSAAVKNALENIMNNPEQAKRIGANGKVAAMKYFDHERYSRGLKEFIEEL